MKHFWYLLFLTATCAAQDAPQLSPEAYDPHPPIPYWTAINQGGPIYYALHLFVVLSFVVAVVGVFVRFRSSRLAIFCMLPFVLGSTAMWLGTLSLIAAVTSYHYDRDIVSAIRSLPRPFYLGLTLSFIAFTVYGISRAFNRNA